MRRERDLSLAPHLRLRFLEEPLREFQPEDDEVFRATGIASVRHADRDMVRIELRSGGESPGDASSVIGLTVDPGSMLIRRVDGEEQWSDGRSRTTTISIEPDAAEVDPDVVPDAEVESAPPIERERPSATPEPTSDAGDDDRPRLIRIAQRDRLAVCRLGSHGPPPAQDHASPVLLQVSSTVQ